MVQGPESQKKLSKIKSKTFAHAILGKIFKEVIMVVFTKGLGHE